MLEEDDECWMKDLEKALCEKDISPQSEDSERFTVIANECRGQVWRQLLTRDDDTITTLLDERPIIKNIEQLEVDCQMLIASLEIEDEEEKLNCLSDTEAILVTMCKIYNTDIYDSNKRWSSIIRPIVSLKLPRIDTYTMFRAIDEEYIAKHQDCYHLLRILLLYHDPELCNLLDSLKIGPEHYSESWIQTLFAETCSLEVILTIWDFYLAKKDRFFIFFLALVFIINARDHVFSLKHQPKIQLIEILGNLPAQLAIDDINDFWSLAEYYDKKTPSSFKKDVAGYIFDHQLPDKGISQMLCLPISVEELISHTNRTVTNSLKFFVMDCRPAEQYNFGHLPIAFPLDSTLLLEDPVSFWTAVEGLLSCQKQSFAEGRSGGGEHWCFSGCGSGLDANQNTHMVVSAFLQKHSLYVSMLIGGYQALHEYFEKNNIDGLSDHDRNKCSQCLRIPQQSKERLTQTNSTNELFSKLGVAMRSKSFEVKGKLMDFLSSNNNSTKNEKKSGSSKRYRNIAPVFAIDEDDNNQDSEDEAAQCNSISILLNKSYVISSFDCQHIRNDGTLIPGKLVLTKNNLIIVEVDSKDSNKISSLINHSLGTILNIKCRKKRPDLIIFEYSGKDRDIDRFIIPQSQSATNIVTKQILDFIERNES
ncbi:TBC1 domain family member 23 [Sipha flava]|uniref:TBC1 domain family member 23 n=1 Tax=Sipha flava TaxID=143950 RepID=A0A2S2R1L8_9HEMI|nr:TBC1 domain family member 23 [Sipha flava]XP_025424731.1 TBC1 domain family member 23 [Sipha flava]